ncbi:MAG: hypothetical protein HQL19_04265 [Candidatus Omnitrophica bacterium]|nr:hypothetical protein [Candidatus Omnitrophota bacterium]
MDDFLSIMLNIARDGGAIALQLIDESCPQLKADDSVITKSDRAVSALAHERLALLLKTGRHILIDEEDPRRGEYLDQGLLERTPFIWSVDPIDGTRAYANRMPHYGISIGLIRDLKPWMGVVYFPSLKELFYSDGTEAFFVTKAFSSEERKTKIVPVEEIISSRSVFITSDELIEKFIWSSKDCRIMVFASAVVEFAWPAIGRGCGSLSSVHLWDFAGAWPIFRQAGLELRSLEGKVLDRLDASLFEGEPRPWKLKEYYILSSAKNYAPLRARLERRGSVDLK